MLITKKITKCKIGVRWEVLINGEVIASGNTWTNKIFRTLKDKAKYEANCFINWLEGTTEYEELLRKEVISCKLPK